MGTQLRAGMRTLTAFLLAHCPVVEAGGGGFAGTQDSCTEPNRDDVGTDILPDTCILVKTHSAPFPLQTAVELQV